MSARRIAIVGGGFIGRSWAAVFAGAGLDVALFDSDPDRLDKLGALLGETFEALPGPALGRVSVEARLADALDGAAYVQECVPERLDVKRAVVAAIEADADTQAVLASSTSALLPSELYANAARPDRCLVAHPLNPPHLLPFVEVVPGPRTDPATVERTVELLAECGQRPVSLAREIPGFLANRLQLALLREAFFLVREGYAGVEAVDESIASGLGMRWAFLGPFLVEASNADGIEDDLRKFQDFMRTMMADVCRPYDGPTDGDVERIVADVERILRGTRQEELLHYRDRMLGILRSAKASHAPPWSPAGAQLRR